MKRLLPDLLGWRMEHHGVVVASAVAPLASEWSVGIIAENSQGVRFVCLGKGGHLDAFGGHWQAVVTGPRRVGLLVAVEAALELSGVEGAVGPSCNCGGEEGEPGPHGIPDTAEPWDNPNCREARDDAGAVTQSELCLHVHGDGSTAFRVFGGFILETIRCSLCGFQTVEGAA